MQPYKPEPHKHAATIKAWADGAEIEHRAEGNHGWTVSKKPLWFTTCEYRVKDPYQELKDALTAGKIIQMKNAIDGWQDISFKPAFGADVSAYRIKPEDRKDETVFSYGANLYNISLVIDGETNRVKSVELIK